MPFVPKGGPEDPGSSPRVSGHDPNGSTAARNGASADVYSGEIHISRQNRQRRRKCCPAVRLTAHRQTQSPPDETERLGALRMAFFVLCCKNNGESRVSAILEKSALCRSNRNRTARRKQRERVQPAPNVKHYAWRESPKSPCFAPQARLPVPQSSVKPRCDPTNPALPARPASPVIKFGCRFRHARLSYLRPVRGLFP